LLGPIEGVMIADYFVWRKRVLDVPALYAVTGPYTYSRGVSRIALVALIAGALPSLPGFLANIRLVDAKNLPALLVHLYDYAWFVGFGIAFAVYLILRKLAPNT
jgi:NCS1 family nucleobase:cation symporter-1